MSICYRVVFETYDDNSSDKHLSRQEIAGDILHKPTNCLDFSMGFDNQIKLIQGVQDKEASQIFTMDTDCKSYLGRYFIYT
jgi:hypothetical protein